MYQSWKCQSQKRDCSVWLCDVTPGTIILKSFKARVCASWKTELLRKIWHAPCCRARSWPAESRGCSTGECQLKRGDWIATNDHVNAGQNKQKQQCTFLILEVGYQFDSCTFCWDLYSGLIGLLTKWSKDQNVVNKGLYVAHRPPVEQECSTISKDIFGTLHIEEIQQLLM